MGYHIANRRIQNTRFAELVPVPYTEFIPTGSILPFMKAAGDTEAPEGWFFLDGGTFDTATNPRLARVFPGGTLPDLGGRTVMAAGTNVTEKAEGGGTATLSESNLPQHAHAVYYSDGQHYHAFGVRGDGNQYTAANNHAGPVGAYFDTDKRATGNYVHNGAGAAGMNATAGGSGTSSPFNVVPAHYGVSCYIIKGG